MLSFRLFNTATALLASSFILWACSSDAAYTADKKPTQDKLVVLDSTLQDNNPDRVTIGTFNIAWLGDGEKDVITRTEEEYKRVAEAIIDTDADILGLQEIENPAAVERVLKYLPGYHFALGASSGAQNVGILYRKNIAVEVQGEFGKLAINKGRQRPGFLAYCRKGNFDFQLMVVHYKSTSSYDNTPQKKQRSREIRTQQAEITRKWARDYIANNAENDVIIVGDFNCSPDRKKFPTLTLLKNDPELHFLTEGLTSCKRADWDAIDHVLVSSSAKERFIPNSVFMLDLRAMYPPDEAEMISDHCPVVVQFEVTSPDND